MDQDTLVKMHAKALPSIINRIKKYDEESKVLEYEIAELDEQIGTNIRGVGNSGVTMDEIQSVMGESK